MNKTVRESQNRKDNITKANKEKESEYSKNRYEEHGQIQVECDCGCVVTKCNLTKHLNTTKHDILTQQKENPQE